MAGLRLVLLVTVLFGAAHGAHAHVRLWDIPPTTDTPTVRPIVRSDAAAARNGPGAAEGLSEMAWLEEPRGAEAWSFPTRLSQSEATWTSHQGVLNRGFGTTVLWVRLRADPQWQSRPGKVALIVGAPYLDHVDIVLPSQGGVPWQSIETGDHHGWKPGLRRARQFVVEWPVAAGDTAYLRIQSASNRLVTVKLASEADAEQIGAVSFLGAGLVLGLLLLLSGWAFTHAALYRDRITLAYGAYQLSALAMSLGLLGISHWMQLIDLLSLGWADVITTYGVLMTSLTGAVFHRVFLQQAQASAWALRFLDVTIAAALGLLVAALAGQAPWALRVNGSFVAFTVSVLVPLFVVPGFRRASRTGRLIRLAYGGLSVLMVSTLLGFLGVFDLGALTLLAPVLHNLGTALLLLLLINLQRREWMAQSQHFQETARLAELESTLAREERDQKDRFLAMLTHELRTPLSVIRLVLDSIKPRVNAADQAKLTHAQGATRDIDDVIERALQTDRLERGNLVIQRQPCELESFVAGIALNHPAGERLEVNLPKQAAVLVTDALWLRTLLANLVDNALKYSAPGTLARLEVSPQTLDGREGISFRVVNEPGPAGVPDAQQVFQKFYRSQGARRTSGSGLGLYLVAGLARELGGRIRMVSDAPPGLVVFELWLPMQ